MKKGEIFIYKKSTIYRGKILENKKTWMNIEWINRKTGEQHIETYPLNSKLVSKPAILKQIRKPTKKEWTTINAELI